MALVCPSPILRVCRVFGGGMSHLRQASKASNYPSSPLSSRVLMCSFRALTSSFMEV